jgi:hypothetical protein
MSQTWNYLHATQQGGIMPNTRNTLFLALGLVLLLIAEMACTKANTSIGREASP